MNTEWPKLFQMPNALEILTVFLKIFHLMEYFSLIATASDFMTDITNYKFTLCSVLSSGIQRHVVLKNRTSSLIWSTSLFPEHKIALLMQCLQSVTDVLFLGIYLIMVLYPKYA
jgi:hypothetical protein